MEELGFEVISLGRYSIAGGALAELEVVAPSAPQLPPMLGLVSWVLGFTPTANWVIISEVRKTIERIAFLVTSLPDLDTKIRVGKHWSLIRAARMSG